MNPTEWSIFEELRKPIELAERLLVAHGIDTITDMEDLAWQLGYEVEYVDGLPPKVGGFVRIDRDGNLIIVINTRTSHVHQIFSIAHEIGHHALNHELTCSQQDPRVEREANLFASALFLHYDGKISSGEFRRENEEIGDAVLAPLILEFLPGLVASIREIYQFFDKQSKAEQKDHLPPN